MIGFHILPSCSFPNGYCFGKKDVCYILWSCSQWMLRQAEQGWRVFKSGDVGIQQGHNYSSSSIHLCPIHEPSIKNNLKIELKWDTSTNTIRSPRLQNLLVSTLQPKTFKWHWGSNLHPFACQALKCYGRRLSLHYCFPTASW